MKKSIIYCLFLVFFLSASLNITADDFWLDYPAANIEYANCIQCFGDTVLILDYINSEIKYSYDNGATWNSVAAPERTKIVYFLSPQIGWALQQYGQMPPKIFRTMDGGQNWIEGDAFPEDIYNYQYTSNCMVFPTVKTGFLCVDVNIFRTDDSGKTFQMIHEKDMGVYKGISYGYSTVWASGDAGEIEKSADEGASWTPMQIPEMGEIPSISALNNDIVHAGTLNGIYRTINGGLSWKKIDPGLTDYTYNKVQTLSPLEIWALGSGLKITHTTDGGLTWQVTNTMLPEKDHKDRTEEVSIIRDFFMRDGEFGWAVGDGGVLHYNTSVWAEDYANAGDVNAYPNPFTDMAVISYYLSAPGNVRIEVFNSLGNKTTRIIDEFQDIGEQKAIFNAAGHPQGLYYYTIMIGGHIEKGKLLLVR